jgi:hypothetical protein
MKIAALTSVRLEVVAVDTLSVLTRRWVASSRLWVLNFAVVANKHDMTAFVDGALASMCLEVARVYALGSVLTRIGEAFSFHVAV